MSSGERVCICVGESEERDREIGVCVCVCWWGMVKERKGKEGRKECVCVFTSLAMLVFFGSHLLRPRED